VDGIHKRKEQANGDGIGTAPKDRARDSLYLSRGRRNEDAPGAIQPFSQTKAPRLWNEGLRLFKQ
jgi:hypothetical protein